MKLVNKFKKIYWTDHSKIKMRQYGLSISKLLGILRKPERKEKGIALGTTAVMRTNKVIKKTKPFFEKEKSKWQFSKKAPGEVWIMYRDTKIRGALGAIPTRKIISAWRYPGISKPGEAIPIPDDIRLELETNGDE